MSRHASLAVNVEDILLGIDLKRENKRHATLFPSKLDLAADFRRQAIEEEDDLSTWEFHAPAQPFIKRRPRVTANAVISPAQQLARNYRLASSMSEAQQIAHRYRTGLKIDIDVATTSSDSTSRSSSTDPSTLVGSERDSWISFGGEETTLKSDQQGGSPIEEPKLRHSDSRAGAVAKARVEALQEIRFASASGALVCPRKDCRATLANVNALSFHLSLHDIEKSKCVQLVSRAPPSINLDDRPYHCARCDQGFDTRQALNTHSCPFRSRSAPSSPIFATFQHVLTKITSRE
ncbi:hypothetical protein F5890DRAFT_1550934 [Lentinula detonsa]|uniref:C2H2-type domain-containing protein n=1 Tax=Lentinula detonsa TaxID=2804962 RepID=A0AA38Q5S6_9AGAR|nr:hypothetical protein F5890DRAFT_1550934 [Lentinula detonsa]